MNTPLIIASAILVTNISRTIVGQSGNMAVEVERRTIVLVVEDSIVTNLVPIQISIPPQVMPAITNAPSVATNGVTNQLPDK